MKPLETEDESRLGKVIGSKEERRIRSKSELANALTGFRVFGIVGWSVVVPTLVGAALGIWLDRHHPQHFSWALSGLLSGLVIGSIAAWNWVNNEYRDMNKKNPSL